MGIELVDGTGTGKTARVSQDNRVATTDIIHTGEFKASLNGKSFFANTGQTADTLTMANADTGAYLYIKNTSTTDQILISNLFISSNTAGVVLKLMKNMTEGTLSAHNSITPVNLNFSSGISATGTFASWDETGTTGIGGLSAGTEVNIYILSAGTLVLPIDEAIILGNSNSIAIHLTNGTGGAAEIACGARFHYETKEKLDELR